MSCGFICPFKEDNPFEFKENNIYNNPEIMGDVCMWIAKNFTQYHLCIERSVDDIKFIHFLNDFLEYLVIAYREYMLFMEGEDLVDVELLSQNFLKRIMDNLYRNPDDGAMRIKTKEDEI